MWYTCPSIGQRFPNQCQTFYLPNCTAGIMYRKILLRILLHLIKAWFHDWGIVVQYNYELSIDRTFWSALAKVSRLSLYRRFKFLVLLPYLLCDPNRLLCRVDLWSTRIVIPKPLGGNRPITIPGYFKCLIQLLFYVSLYQSLAERSSINISWLEDASRISYLLNLGLQSKDPMRFIAFDVKTAFDNISWEQLERSLRGLVSKRMRSLLRLYFYNIHRSIRYSEEAMKSYDLYFGHLIKHCLLQGDSISPILCEIYIQWLVKRRLGRVISRSVWTHVFIYLDNVVIIYLGNTIGVSSEWFQSIDANISIHSIFTGKVNSSSIVPYCKSACSAQGFHVKYKGSYRPYINTVWRIPNLLGIEFVS